MSFEQRQEETVRILREFVRRQELARDASARALVSVPPPSRSQPPYVEPQRTSFDYVDTASGDL